MVDKKVGEAYNHDKRPCNDASADNTRVSEGIALAQVPDSAQKWQAGKAPTVSSPQPPNTSSRSRRAWRRRFGSFVAEECGVKFVPAVAQYDPKRAEKTLEKREALTDADVRDSERFLRELIERPTINPDQEAPVVIQGESLPALKAAILQGLARASQPKDRSFGQPKSGGQ